ncbi:hypothetical protein OsI_38288 [Oryza sativa Indica Group]|uniref:Uncharacterized protein n=1 Tax=Oryza sativa subsp. indica TaxID=39946 RepID=B8BPK9_ORYSI|nr:hypothetical protein OsI_38288 [Oryza sativa Indica Group]
MPPSTKMWSSQSRATRRRKRWRRSWWHRRKGRGSYRIGGNTAENNDAILSAPHNYEEGEEVVGVKLRSAASQQACGPPVEM